MRGRVRGLIETRVGGGNVRDFGRESSWRGTYARAALDYHLRRGKSYHLLRAAHARSYKAARTLSERLT